MTRFVIALIILGLGTASLAAESPFARQAPDKPAGTATSPPADPAVWRQGGDAIADAVPITFPAYETGTTVGYNDDYDEVCPFSGSTSPDVVYSLAPEVDLAVGIDLFGSDYDTKVYVYDADQGLLGCNDDHHADFTSYLEVDLLAGGVYYIVIDGYGGDAGEYVMDVHQVVDCELEIPANAYLEGEPPLENDAWDCYNNGCQTQEGCEVYWNWQTLPGDEGGNLTFAGKSGWYLFNGGQTREADSFEATIGAEGMLEIMADAEEATYVFHVGPTDCAAMSVLASVQVGPCQPGTLTIHGEPGELVWVWVGPTTFEPPGGEEQPVEYDYLLWISGLQSAPVSTESHSWSEVKSLFR